MRDYKEGLNATLISNQEILAQNVHLSFALRRAEITAFLMQINYDDIDAEIYKDSHS